MYMSISSVLPLIYDEPSLYRDKTSFKPYVYNILPLKNENLKNKVINYEYQI